MHACTMKLVGAFVDRQAPFVDIEWLGLRAGVDYRESVDIAEQFRTWNVKYGTSHHAQPSFQRVRVATGYMPGL